MLKKLSILILMIILTTSFVFAQDNTIEINGVEFDIPDKYLGGRNVSNGYMLNNTFSILCIDDDISSRVGFWACESDNVENLEIGSHPVRHYYTYNTYVNDIYSHAYFACGNSIFEIAWVGEELTPDIINIIRDTPNSEIENTTFNSILDESITSYQQDRPNNEIYYYYYKQPKDDNQINQILLTYFNNM